MKLESIQNYSYNTKYSLNKPRFKALRVGHFECANKVIHSAEKSLPREVEYYKQNLNIKSDKQKKQALEIKLYKYLKDSVNNIDYIVSTLFGDIDKLDKLTDSFINKEIAPIKKAVRLLILVRYSSMKSIRMMVLPEPVGDFTMTVCLERLSVTISSSLMTAVS